MTADQPPTPFVRFLSILFLLAIVSTLAMTANAFYRVDWVWTLFIMVCLPKALWNKTMNRGSFPC